MASRVLLPFIGRCLRSSGSPFATTTSLTRSSPIYTIPVRSIITLNPDEVRLNNLRDNEGAIKYGIRIGRGIGTGRGKTSKRGHKGQKSRTGRGKPAAAHQGGAVELYRTMRKYGFDNSRFARRLDGVNLDVLQHHINTKTINPYKKITIKELYDAKIIRKGLKKGVKILARGADSLTTPNLHLEVSDCSSAARDVIEKLGGKVDLVYHNRVSLRYTVKPEKFFLRPTFGRPPPKIHASKYPNFPDPTPFTSPPLILENLEYPPDFNTRRKAEQKERLELMRSPIKPEKKKTVRQLKKDQAKAKAEKAEKGKAKAENKN